LQGQIKGKEELKDLEKKAKAAEKERQTLLK